MLVAFYYLRCTPKTHNKKKTTTEKAFVTAALSFCAYSPNKYLQLKHCSFCFKNKLSLLCSLLHSSFSIEIVCSQFARSRHNHFDNYAQNLYNQSVALHVKTTKSSDKKSEFSNFEQRSDDDGGGGESLERSHDVNNDTDSQTVGWP